MCNQRIEPGVLVGRRLDRLSGGQSMRGSGKQVFKSWSDGALNPRTIVAPPSGGAYTANFAKR